MPPTLSPGELFAAIDRLPRARLATAAAILTDPVYSAKALAGLIADVRAKKDAKDAVVVYIHTGGVPAIFANPKEVLPGGLKV